MVLLLFPPKFAISQSTGCVPVTISAVGDTFRIDTNRDSIIVRADKTEDEMRIEAACVEIATAGFYRMVTGVAYSGGKSNESFFMTVQHNDSTLAVMCDANAGPFKVINIVQDLPKADFDTTRDAGVFYFTKGTNHIFLNHYALIADEYPDFFNPHSNGFDGPESVHLFKIVLEYAYESGFDLELTQRVSQDTVAAGEPYFYMLQLTNNGPDETGNIQLTNTLPSLVAIADDKFNIAPDSSTVAEGTRTLYWNFESLTAGNAIDIVFEASLSESPATDTTFLVIESFAQAVALCDTNLANNFDSTTTILVILPELSDVSVALAARTDSFAVAGPDTAWFAGAGDILIYHITVRNESDVTAQQVVVQNVLPDSVSATDPELADTVTWVLGSLAPFSDTTFTLPVVVATIMPEGLNFLIHKAVVAAQNENPARRANNAAVDTVFNFVPPVLPRLVDVFIEQTVKTDSFVVAGADTSWHVSANEKYSYTLRIANSGNVTAEDIEVIDRIPQFTFSELATQEGTIIWYIGELAAQTDTLLTFELTVAATLPAGRNLLINEATVAAENETAGHEQNNVAVDTVFNLNTPVVRTLTDLSISQHVETDSFTVQAADTIWFVQPGQSFSYFINVRNEDTVDARNTVVLDLLPELVSATRSSGADTVIWHVGTLAAFQDTTLRLEVRVSSEVLEEAITLVNKAIVRADNEDPDKLGNNVSVQANTILVVPEPLFSEGCDLFTLGLNVYRPETGAPLTLNFELASAKNVRLDVYDLSGHHVRTLISDTFEAGPNQLHWDGVTSGGEKVGSGVYVITLRTDTFTCWKKVIIAR